MAPCGVSPGEISTELESGAVSGSFPAVQPGRGLAGQSSQAASHGAGVQPFDEMRNFRSALGYCPPGSAARLKSFRICLGFKSSDNGFERIYQDLACLADDAARSQHIKRLLIAISLGVDVAGWPALAISPEGIKNQSPSFNVKFRMSSRDGGLEALNAELGRMPEAAQRNQFIKRLLFKAYLAVPKQALAAQPATPVPQGSPQAVVSPPTEAFGSLADFSTWSAAPATPAPAHAEDEAEAEARRAFKRKNNPIFL